MKKILITGGKGQLGSEFNRLQSQYSEFDFLFTDIDTLDLTDKEAVRSFISSNSPDYIINCAAYTAVDKAEDDSELCYKINCDAIQNLAEATCNTTAKIIHISTDYVFDGTGNTPYKESYPTNPQSVYGKSKLQGEQILSTIAPESIIIRTAWLYSSFGNNFVKTMLRLAKERTELRVVSDQIGTPTYAGDLALAILSIIQYSEKEQRFHSGIYHYSNEAVCSWFDLAQNAIDMAGITGCQLIPIPTSEYPTKAQRPMYSVLDKTKIKETFNLTVPFDSLQQCIQLLAL